MEIIRMCPVNTNLRNDGILRGRSGPHCLLDVTDSDHLLRASDVLCRCPRSDKDQKCEH